MIHAYHILHLLNYAAEELWIMVESGRHAEVHAASAELVAQVGRIRPLVGRAQDLHEADAMNAAAIAAAEAFGVEAGRLSSARTADERHARNTAIVAAAGATCRTRSIAQRFGVSRQMVYDVLSARRSWRPAADDARLSHVMQRMLGGPITGPGGDGAAVEITATDSRETNGGGR